MSKKVVWGNVANTNKPVGYSSIEEFTKRANAFRQEQERAQSYLQKAYVPMVKLLEMRLLNRQPLTVMRPLKFQTSEVPEDDGFYKSNSTKFVDVIKVINPGTQITLKEIDTGMQEFIFEDALGKSYNISFSDKNLLLTQTDIFETTASLLEAK